MVGAASPMSVGPASAPSERTHSASMATARTIITVLIQYLRFFVHEKLAMSSPSCPAGFVSFGDSAQPERPLFAPARPAYGLTGAWLDHCRSGWPESHLENGLYWRPRFAVAVSRPTATAL